MKTHTAMNQVSSHRVRRRAMLLVAVLVCLAVTMTLLAGSVRTALLQRQQVRAQQDRMQAEYLADSALQRATAQLAADPRYSGETWQIDSQQLAMHSAARVVIRVEPSGERPEELLIRVAADVPDEGSGRARRSKETKITLSGTGKKP